MTAYEIFEELTPDDAHALLEDFSRGNREAYRACVQVTATRRKLRPVFLEKKPRTERHEWMRNVLAAPRNEDVGLEMLQNWLLRQHREMITGFLDRCGVEHREGIIDEVPPQPDFAKVQAAVDELLEKYPAVQVKVYLRLFQPQDEEAWPDFDEMMRTDPRLALRPEDSTSTDGILDEADPQPEGSHTV